MEAPPPLPLAAGAVKEMAEQPNGPGTTQPVLQVAEVQPVNAKGAAAGVHQLGRLRMLVSDGVHSLQSLLCTDLNHLFRDGTLRPGSIVQLMDIVCNTIQGRRVIIVCKLDVLRSECAMIGKPKLYETKTIREGQEPNLQSNAVAPRVEQFPNNLPYCGPSNGVHSTVGSSIGRTIKHEPNNVLSGRSYGTLSAQNTMNANVVQMDLNVLERMLLDESAKPMNLTLSLLEDITNGFSLDHQIGSGGFAMVYKGTVGKLGVAVKKLTKTHLLPESKFHKEIECLMKARHRNIVRFLGYCAETQGKAEDCEGRFVMADMRNWLLCFEYVPNGSLEKYITDASSGLEWRERFGIIKGICHGIYYLHKNRILHLDLKPANILLDDHMEPKIADFGLSRCLGEEQTRATTKHLSGTPGYLAPEFFNGKVAFASDIYSLGIIIMEILTGAKGYPEDENVTESWMNRLEGELQLEQVRVCTKIGIECMESDPKKRPVALRIINMLDKMASADETGRSSSVVERQSSLLLEHSAQDKIGKLAESLNQEDTKEHLVTEDVAERLGNDHSQEGQENENHWSSWEGQDTDRKTKSSVLDKLNILTIF